MLCLKITLSTAQCKCQIFAGRLQVPIHLTFILFFLTIDNLTEDDLLINKGFFAGICLIILVVGLLVGGGVTMLLCRMQRRKSQKASKYQTLIHSHTRCKESHFYSLPFGKLKPQQACTSPTVISTNPKNFLMSRIDHSSSVI